MSRYKAYPEYKDSGVEWFGCLPAQWDVKRISYISQLRSGDAIVSEQIEAEGSYAVYGGNGLRGYSSSFNLEGDYILIGRQGALCGNINYGSGKFWASEHAVVVHPFFDVNIKWLGETLRAMNLNQYNVSAAQPGLAVTNITCLKIPFPSRSEQEKIANFLDHETAKIDALIEKQQRLIELLKEKRQAVISHAVTKGLNPNAPMKDSGVEWLGEVPVHWSLKKISHIGRVLNGSTPDKSNFSFWNEGSIPWLASSCLNSPTVDEPTELISAQAFKRSSLELIPAGSLLVGMVGQGKTRGTSAVLTIESCINQNMAAIIPSKHVNINFLYYLFQAMYHDLRELGRGGNQAALNCEIVASIRVPIPAIEEQQCIVSFISRQLAVMILATDSADQQIKLLHERRSALISAAVTGKIDVRDWQAAA